jgi:hypothetical protein
LLFFLNKINLSSWGIKLPPPLSNTLMGIVTWTHCNKGSKLPPLLNNRHTHIYI